MPLNIVSLTWYFGDGTTAYDSQPSHIYALAGVFYPTLVATDEFGNEYTFVSPVAIVVSNNIDYLVIGATNFCFRLGTKVQHGNGITPFGGPGWIWPAPLCSTVKGYNDSNEDMSLVIDAKTGQIFQIGQPDVWTDRTGTALPQEIPCMVKLPEIMSRFGPNENVRHIETHLATLPMDESVGYRSAFNVALQIFSHGNPVAAAQLSQVILNGDYAYLKEVEARGIQEMISFATSGFRFMMAQIRAQEIDFRTPPQLNAIPEKTYQQYIGQNLIAWFSRNKRAFNMNRADGTYWATGTSTALAGPDGLPYSASSVGSALVGTIPDLSGNFTVMLWVFLPSGGGGSGGIQVGALSIMASDHSLSITDGVDTFTVTMPSGWVSIVVARSIESGGVNILDVFINGNQVLDTSFSAIRAYTGNVVIGTGIFFDVRIMSVALNDPHVPSAVIPYYYQAVLSGGGGVLP